jgi:hypothetical protein
MCSRLHLLQEYHKTVLPLLGNFRARSNLDRTASALSLRLLTREDAQQNLWLWPPVAFCQHADRAQFHFSYAMNPNWHVGRMSARLRSEFLDDFGPIPVVAQFSLV